MAEDATPPSAKNDPKDAAEERRRSRTQTAYFEIGDRLSDLRFPPGFRFTEAEVAKDLGMSKTPVREALLMFVAQDLVVPRPGAGYVVAPITLRDVRLLFRHWRRLMLTVVDDAIRVGITSPVSVHIQDALEKEPPHDRNHLIFDTLVWVADDRFVGREFSVLSIEVRRLLKLVLDPSEPALVAHLDEIFIALTTGEERASELVVKHIDELEQSVITALLSGDFLQGASLTAPKNGR